MRAAIYARVSSERQEKEHTIGSQLEALRNYAARHGMDMVEEFTDEGYSGARLDRPALDRMRDLAERQKFSSRNLQETAYLLRKLVRCGHCGLSCFARTMNQTADRANHYYICQGVVSFLKEERCSQRSIGADALDELVWEEVSTRLQDPELVLEAYREDRTHRVDRDDSVSSEQAQKLATQIELANTERTRLLDAYQVGAIELAELQKRRRLVDSKLETLNREKELLEKMAREQRQEGDARGDLEEFAVLVSSRLQHFSFEGKWKLLRMVLDKVVVKDWRVDVHYKIPLPRPSHPVEQKVSTNFDLCCARMLVQTGGRTYSEGFRLRWDQVDWDQKLIRWGNPVKTAGSSEPLPLSDLAYRVLLKWKEESNPDSPYIFPSPRKPGQPIRSVKTAWKATLKRAGVPHFPIYNLRHAFCTRLSWVAPDAVIQRAMRHTSPETKRQYQLGMVEQVREAMERANERVYGERVTIQ